MGRKRLTRSERMEVYNKCGGHCAYCGCEITIDQMQVDHKIPIHMEETFAICGKDLNDMENLLPACRSCNNYKSTLSVERFRKMLEKQPAILGRDQATFRLATRYKLVIPNPHPVKFYFEEMAGGEKK